MKKNLIDEKNGKYINNLDEIEKIPEKQDILFDNFPGSIHFNIF